MALKKVSARALSQHRPVRPCDRMTPWSSARVANSAEVYWQPRPAGLDDPGPDDPAADQVLCGPGLDDPGLVDGPEPAAVRLPTRYLRGRPAVRKARHQRDASVDQWR